jgi:putative acetyltransferase
MSAIKLREAREEDRAAMIELWVEAWTQVFPQIDFRARTDWFESNLTELTQKGARATLAFDEAGLAGFSLYDPQTRDMDQLCVALRAQGSPVAGLLVQALKRQSDRLTLTVNRDNPRARRFYEREGFTVTGEGVSAASNLPILFMEWRAGREA